MRANPVLIALLLLLGVSAVHASSSAPSNTIFNQFANINFPCLGSGISQLSASSINTAIYTGIGLSLIALIISLDFIALAFIISKAVPASGIKGWISTEYTEVIKSAIIIAAIFFSLSIVSSISAILSGQPGGGTIGTNVFSVANSANSYLCTASSNMGSDMDTLFTMGYAVGFMKGIEITNTASIGAAGITVLLYAILPENLLIGGLAFGSGSHFFPYVNDMVEATAGAGQYQSILNDVLRFMIMPTFYLISFETVFMQILVPISLVLLIPVGLILRALPVTRSLGGSFIAIGIGLAIIYPATITLFNAPISAALGTPNFDFNAMQPQSIQSAQGTGYFYDIVEEIAKLSSYLNDFLTARGSAVITGFESFTEIYPALNFIIATSYYSILQFILFVFDFAIVLSLTRGIASYLGGTVKTSLGISRMRLV